MWGWWFCAARNNGITTPIMTDVVEEGSFDPIFIAYGAIILMALFPIYVGSHRSLTSKFGVHSPSQRPLFFVAASDSGIAQLSRACKRLRRRSLLLCCARRSLRLRCDVCFFVCGLLSFVVALSACCCGAPICRKINNILLLFGFLKNKCL